jgi:hypothetical protein
MRILDRFLRLLRRSAARPGPRGHHRGVGTTADPRRVREVSEEYAWIGANRCACGGVWDVEAQRAFGISGGFVDELDVTCEACGVSRTFTFELRE